jgi:crotonobetainyl-CoA:carnitine CoA-transferase CaiB-like acyl-CoA transferase
MAPAPLKPLAMRALEGILVVALEQAVAAPLCSCRLADAGARVIKIERPEGDFARRYDRFARGESSYFVWLNRGKESLTLDVKQAADKALLHRLVARADVFIENLAPGAAARLGFGPANLRRARPSLITCAIQGFGAGPYAERKAYDLLIQAETGLASVTGTPEAAGRVGVSVTDIATGMNAYAAILEALIRRGRTGEGAELAVSLFDATAEWMAVPLVHFAHDGKGPRRLGLNHPSIAPYGIYRAGDGGEFLISIQNEREWVSLCAEVVGDAALAADSRFATNPLRVEHRPALDALLAAAFTRYDSAALLARLSAAGVAFGAFNDVAGLAHHPHLRQVAVATEQGPVAVPAPPAQEAGQIFAAGRVPRLGEHNDKIRAEFSA